MSAVMTQPKVLKGNPGVVQPKPYLGWTPCQCPMCRHIRTQPAELLKRGALEWVNMLRTEWGLPALAELPPGRRGSNTGCVIARALERVAVVPGHCAVLENGYVIPTPPAVQQFIVAFDSGMFPELVA